MTWDQPEEVVHAACELDSHADTCVAGPNCRIIELTDQVVSVSAFSKEHNILQDIPIVTAATAYDDPTSGTTYILILGQAIWMGDKVEATLLCPNQLRYNGIVVDDIPTHLAPSHQPSTHSIHCADDDLTLPLSLQGIISYFDTRTPTTEELDTCKWIIITNENDWDPHSPSFQEREANAKEIHNMNEYRPHGRYIYSCNKHQQNNSFKATIHKSDLNQISEAFDDGRFASLQISSTSTSSRNHHTAAQMLAHKWCIGLETAKNTLKVTTQKGIRNPTHPIERRYRTKQSQLRYRQLSGRHGRFYTDTFFSNSASLNGCKMAQLYINDLSFTKVYPMKLKSETSHTLAAFIHDVGIPHTIHSDDAPELMQGKFRALCRDYGIATTYTEPYSPWQNRAEGGIRELKRHVHRKMKTNKVPTRLWDFCCKWSCDIRNKTSSNHFQLEGRTPFEALMGTTPNISSLIDFDFYQPVWYYDQLAEFPEPKRHAARWLGEAYDIGQAMCYWIIPSSGIPIVRSTIQSISIEQMNLESTISELKELDHSIYAKLGYSEDVEKAAVYYDYNLHEPQDASDEDVPDYLTPA